MVKIEIDGQYRKDSQNRIDSLNSCDVVVCLVSCRSSEYHEQIHEYVDDVDIQDECTEHILLHQHFMMSTVSYQPRVHQQNLQTLEDIDFNQNITLYQFCFLALIIFIGWKIVAE